MNYKKADNSFLSNLACALCNLGLINPQETYRNSKGEITKSVLFKDDCKSCYPFYEQSLKTNNKEDYTQKKD